MNDNAHLYSCLISNRPDAGFFGSEFDADGLPVGYPVLGATDAEREVLRVAALDGWRSQRRERSEHRLVKETECPTPFEEGKKSEDIRRGAEGQGPFIEMRGGRVNLDTGEVIKDYNRENHTKVIFEHKPWADEYRVRTKCEMPITTRPPEHTGERVTTSLTIAGAQKMAESCRYVHKKRGGYSTFATLTLDEEARERVKAGETVQKQLSRFLDAMQKIWKRGWVENYEGTEHRGEAHGDEPLDYCWVIENPKNADGEDNPHVHIMLRWRVPYKDFQAWAQRIERLWGQGFAHLEKIKEPEKAGAYMAKAAGYMTKGQDGDQGEVRGNRYGISKPARATGWECVGIYDAGIMGTLINDVHEFFQLEYGPKIARREFLKRKLDETPKTDKGQRKRIGEALEAVRSELTDEKKLPVRPSKYSLTMVGVNAFRSFLNWAKDGACRKFAHWLPVKPKGVTWAEETRPEGVYLKEFKRQIWAERMHRAKGACSAFWQSMNRGAVPDWALADKSASVDDFVMA